MEQTEPKYDNVIDITDLLRDKSDKRMKVEDKGQYGVVLGLIDQKGEGYFFEIEDGKVKKAYRVGGRKEQIPDFQSLLRQYNLNRLLDDSDIGYRNAA